MVSLIPEVQEATHGSEESKRRIHRRLVRGRKIRLRIGPAFMLFHGAHGGKPARRYVVLKAARTILHIRLKVEHRVRKLAVAVARQFRQALDQGLGLPDHDIGNQPVLKTREQFLVAIKKPAIQQGKNRLCMIGIELDEFRDNSHRRVALQSDFAHALRKTLNRILEFFRRFARCRQEYDVDIRIRKKSLPAKISDGGEYNPGGFKTCGNGKLRPKTAGNGIHQRRSFLQIFQAIFGRGKIVLEPCGFSLVVLSQFIAEWGLCGHASFSGLLPRIASARMARHRTKNQ